MTKIRKNYWLIPEKNAELMDRQTDSSDFIGPPQRINHQTIRLICKYLDEHLPGNNSVSSDQQLPRMYF